MTFPLDIPGQNSQKPPSSSLLYFILAIVGILCLPVLSHGQSREDLERKRERLLQEISATEAALSDTQKDKEATLEQYIALRTQIRNRQELVKTLEEELKQVDASIRRSELVLAALKGDIDRLKTEYAHTMRVAYRHKLSQSMLVFLFSAESFNDAFSRWQYIRQYDRFRKKQAYNIVVTQEMLTERTAQLEARRVEQQQLLTAQKQQTDLLQSEFMEKNRLLKKLNTSEKQLMSQLEEQQSAHEGLNQAIEDIIVAEMTRKRRAARDRVPTETSATPAEPPGAKLEAAATLSRDFSSQKGRLPWPVRNGRVSKSFGKAIVMEDTGLKLPNNGIEIQAEEGAEIFPVFAGEVTHITFVPVYQNAILVNHGDFFTLYYRIEEVLVRKGQAITPGQPIGRLSDSNSMVHFEIWEGTQKLNPETWLENR
ncbi:MAG: peptidoglycan DD-metalloendopeptidase family protein [Phaeodactylibacter sp.]|nr:peptidoglycan DD-metalloendopeptidase family protein [Phaeodactylibacter sp.]